MTINNKRELATTESIIALVDEHFVRYRRDEIIINASIADLVNVVKVEQLTIVLAIKAFVPLIPILTPILREQGNMLSYTREVFIQAPKSPSRSRAAVIKKLLLAQLNNAHRASAEPTYANEGYNQAYLPEHLRSALIVPPRRIMIAPEFDILLDADTYSAVHMQIQYPIGWWAKLSKYNPEKEDKIKAIYIRRIEEDVPFKLIWNRTDDETHERSIREALLPYNPPSSPHRVSTVLDEEEDAGYSLPDDYSYMPGSSDDPTENPWIDVFGPGDEADTAYWNTQ